MDHVHLNCFTRMKLIMIMYKGIISNKWIHEKMKKNWCKKQKKDILNIKELCKKNILTFLFTKKKMLKKFTWIERAKACASASSSDIPPCTDCRWFDAFNWLFDRRFMAAFLFSKYTKTDWLKSDSYSDERVLIY